MQCVMFIAVHKYQTMRAMLAIAYRRLRVFVCCLFVYAVILPHPHRRLGGGGGFGLVLHMVYVAVRHRYYSMFNACNRLMLCVICACMAFGSVLACVRAHTCISINYTCASDFIMFAQIWQTAIFGCAAAHFGPNQPIIGTR